MFKPILHVRVVRMGDAMYGRTGTVILQSAQGPRLQPEPHALVQWDDRGAPGWIRSTDLEPSGRRPH